MPENSQPTGGWFEAFYERNYRLVYRLCFTYLKSQAEAEDCTEDVFVKVLTGAMNLCKDRLKRWWRKRVTSLDEAPEIPDEKGSGPGRTSLHAAVRGGGLGAVRL